MPGRLETRGRGILADGDGACFGWQSPGSSRGAAGAPRQGSPADEISGCCLPATYRDHPAMSASEGRSGHVAEIVEGSTLTPQPNTSGLIPVTIERPIDRSL